MKVVTIRGLSDELHARLKQRARENRRSLNQQILVELTALKNEKPQRERVERLIASAKKLRAQIDQPLTAEEIRRGIDERRR